jgi:hypothetical protein
VFDRQGRNLFHWAGMRHDLRLAQQLLQHTATAPADQTLTHADRQGALPWMYVLRRAELSALPMSDDATQLLKLLLPPGTDVNATLRKPLEAGSGEAFPAGWTAAAVAIHQPAAREVLGPALDFGRLPPDPSRWWKFRDAQEAEDFVASLTREQLERAEQPVTVAGQAGQPLSEALAASGWPQLAQQAQRAPRR